MILFLLLLIAAGALVAVYATSNAGTHDVTFLQWHWSAVPDWAPVVITAAVIGGLFLLYMIYAGLAHGMRVGSQRRRISSLESTVTDLRRENQRLREQNVGARSELRGVDRGVAATSDRPVTTGPAREETPASQGTERERVDAATPVDRPRATQPYRRQPTFGERVRSFFTGREPAGY
jgi:uncharacterized integral membrane protein